MHVEALFGEVLDGEKYTIFIQIAILFKVLRGGGCVFLCII